MKKLIENLNTATKLIHSADHLLYTTYPVIKDKKIIIQVLKEINTALVKILNTILQYEYIFKRIKLTKNPKENLKTFEEKCSKRYGITQEELNQIKEIFKLTNMQKKSPMVFKRKEKIVILEDNLNHDEINLNKIKNFLNLSKNILKKTKEGIKYIL